MGESCPRCSAVIGVIGDSPEMTAEQLRDQLSAVSGCTGLSNSCDAIQTIMLSRSDAGIAWLLVQFRALGALADGDERLADLAGRASARALHRELFEMGVG